MHTMSQFFYLVWSASRQISKEIYVERCTGEGELGECEKRLFTLSSCKRLWRRRDLCVLVRCRHFRLQCRHPKEKDVSLCFQLAPAEDSYVSVYLCLAGRERHVHLTVQVCALYGREGRAESGSVYLLESLGWAVSWASKQTIDSSWSILGPLR